MWYNNKFLILCHTIKIINLKGDKRIMDFENNEMEEELDNIIVLNDEEGNEVQFEFLDLIEYEDEEYVILLPIEEETDEDKEKVIVYDYLDNMKVLEKMYNRRLKGYKIAGYEIIE